MTCVLFHNSIVSIIPKFNIMCRYIEPRNPALMIIKVYNKWFFIVGLQNSSPLCNFTYGPEVG